MNRVAPPLSLLPTFSPLHKIDVSRLTLSFGSSCVHLFFQANTGLVRHFGLNTLAAVSNLLDPVDSSDRDWTALADLLGFTLLQKRQFVSDEKSPSQRLLEAFSQRNGTKAVLERALRILHRCDVLAELGYTVSE